MIIKNNNSNKKKILIIDFETSSLDPLGCEIFEFGFLQSTIDKKIIQCGSFLIENIKENIEYPSCNDIDQELVLNGIKKEEACKKIYKLIQDSDYIVSHNGKKFDFIILERLFNEQVPFNDNILTNKIFIDTMVDLPLKHGITSLKLAYLALEYGIIMQESHRAINDVIGLFKLICKFDFETIINFSQAKSVTLIAEQSFAKNPIKKILGFKWDADNKVWKFSCKVFELENIENKCKAAGLNYIIN